MCRSVSGAFRLLSLERVGSTPKKEKLHIERIRLTPTLTLFLFATQDQKTYNSRNIEAIVLKRTYSI
jgi:hypothetical protein